MTAAPSKDQSSGRVPLGRRALFAVVLLGVALLLNRNFLLASLGYETAESRLRSSLNHARGLSSQGKIDEALEIASNLYRDSPGDLRVVSFLLDINLVAGRPSRTAQLAERALTRNPSLHGFRLRLAEAQRQLGHLQEAEANLGEVLAKQPKSLWAHFYLGRVLQDSQRLEEAEGKFRQVLDRSPQFLVALLQLAEILEQSGRNDEAMELYRRSHAEVARDRLAALERRLGREPSATGSTSHGPHTSGG